MGWQRVSGYNWRALVEADISRWKRVIGEGLRFQTDERQATEVAIAADVLNRMLDLGLPEYVRIALPRTREGSVRPHRRSTQQGGSHTVQAPAKLNPLRSHSTASNPRMVRRAV